VHGNGVLHRDLKVGGAVCRLTWIVVAHTKA